MFKKILFLGALLLSSFPAYAATICPAGIPAFETANVDIPKAVPGSTIQRLTGPNAISFMSERNRIADEHGLDAIKADAVVLFNDPTDDAHINAAYFVGGCLNDIERLPVSILAQIITEAKIAK